MDIKTFNKARLLISQIEKCEDTVSKLIIKDTELDWINLRVNTTNSAEGKDLNLLMYSKNDEDKELMLKIIALIKDHYDNFKDEAKIKLDEL